MAIGVWRTNVDTHATHTHSTLLHTDAAHSTSDDRLLGRFVRRRRRWRMGEFLHCLSNQLVARATFRSHGLPPFSSSSARRRHRSSASNASTRALSHCARARQPLPSFSTRHAFALIVVVAQRRLPPSSLCKAFTSADANVGALPRLTLSTLPFDPIHIYTCMLSHSLTLSLSLPNHNERNKRVSQTRVQGGATATATWLRRPFAARRRRAPTP
jgi:hypothetical protein